MYDDNGPEFEGSARSSVLAAELPDLEEYRNRLSGPDSVVLRDVFRQYDRMHR